MRIVPAVEAELRGARALDSLICLCRACASCRAAPGITPPLKPALLDLVPRASAPR